MKWIPILLASATPGMAQDCVPADWWSNQTSAQNVVEGVDNGNFERVRLGDSNTGFIEGIVTLPSSGTWTILFGVSTDGNADIPTEFTRVLINGIEVDTFHNTPAGPVLTSTTYDVTGSSFSYRFEFSSPDPVWHHHMAVTEGTIVRLDGSAVGTRYCSGAPNSVGPGSYLCAMGSASLSANDLVLRASVGPYSQSGLFFYGPEQVGSPFGDGLLCVGTGGLGVFRVLPVLQANYSGITTLEVDLTLPPAGVGPGEINVGSTWNFQFWYRDPLAGASGFNLSDALSVSFAP